MFELTNEFGFYNAFNVHQTDQTLQNKGVQFFLIINSGHIVFCASKRVVPC